MQLEQLKLIQIFFWFSSRAPGDPDQIREVKNFDVSLNLFESFFEQKPKRNQKHCKPRLLRNPNPESRVPIVDIASAPELSIMNLSSDSEKEVSSDAETIISHSIKSVERNILISNSEL